MSKFLSGAVALIALGNTAIAAEQCKTTDWALDADTAHCYLRVDGRIVTDGACRITIAHDGREYDIADMNSGTEAQVAMMPTQSGSPVYGLWNRGSKSDTAKMINYGRVHSEPIGKKGEMPWCWHNNRFRMCISGPYLICDKDGAIEEGRRQELRQELENTRQQQREDTRRDTRQYLEDYWQDRAQDEEDEKSERTHAKDIRYPKTAVVEFPNEFRGYWRPSEEVECKSTDITEDDGSIRVERHQLFFWEGSCELVTVVASTDGSYKISSKCAYLDEKPELGREVWKLTKVGNEEMLVVYYETTGMLKSFRRCSASQ